MTIVAITLRSTSVPDGTPLVVDLLNGSLDLQWRGAVPVNTTVTLPKLLTSGPYAIIVGLPSGQAVHLTLKVEDEERTMVDVVLPSTSVMTGVAIPAAGGTTRSADPRSSLGQLPPDATLGKIWVRVWSRDASRRWRVRRCITELQPAADGSVTGQFDTDELPYGQHYIQIGGGSSQPRMVALPPGRTSFVLKPSFRFDIDETSDITVTVDIHAGGPEAQALIGYLTNGDLERAQVIGTDFVAGRLAGDVSPDPTTGVLAAYYLLASRDLERLGHLIDQHLVKWASWLPDAAVIAAWKSLRQEPPDVEKARDHLVEAARCGVPIYTRGLRLLLDGLRMVQADEELSNVDVRRALNSARRFARVADWRPPFTTFFAVHPGKPVNPQAGIRWLTDAQQAALDPRSHFPWAPSAQPIPRNRQAFQEEMRGHFSASFSRAFAYPPGHQNIEAAEDAYRALQEDMKSMIEEAAS